MCGTYEVNVTIGAERLGFFLYPKRYHKRGEDQSQNTRRSWMWGVRNRARLAIGIDVRRTPRRARWRCMGRSVRRSLWHYASVADAGHGNLPKSSLQRSDELCVGWVRKWVRGLSAAGVRGVSRANACKIMSVWRVPRDEQQAWRPACGSRHCVRTGVVHGKRARVESLVCLVWSRERE